jgi:hypothetical protein
MLCYGIDMILYMMIYHITIIIITIIIIIISWEHCRICGPSLTETSLCDTYLYTRTCFGTKVPS